MPKITELAALITERNATEQWLAEFVPLVEKVVLLVSTKLKLTKPRNLKHHFFFFLDRSVYVKKKYDYILVWPDGITIVGILTQTQKDELRVCNSGFILAKILQFMSFFFFFVRIT